MWDFYTLEQIEQIVIEHIYEYYCYYSRHFGRYVLAL